MFYSVDGHVWPVEQVDDIASDNTRLALCPGRFLEEYLRCTSDTVHLPCALDRYTSPLLSSVPPTIFL